MSLAGVDDPAGRGLRFYEAMRTRRGTPRPGMTVRVDSFLGTVNNADSAIIRGNPDDYLVDAERTHPRLRELSERFGLAAIVDAHTGDYERALRVLEWVHTRWSHGMPESYPAYDAVLILERAERGEAFLCMHYSVVLIQALGSLGIPARLVNLHRRIERERPLSRVLDPPPVDEHVVAEAWCSELAKWVVLDPDYGCAFELDGVPLAAWEIHQVLKAGRLARLDVRHATHLTNRESDTFYRWVLPTYYSHVSVLGRSDFLSNTEGPVPAIHVTDEMTPPVLWHRGEDMRLHSMIVGPITVAEPFGELTTVLTDGNPNTAWASADQATDHWVEITFDSPRLLHEVGLTWPVVNREVRRSSDCVAETQVGERWIELGRLERARDVVTFAPASVAVMRIRQLRGGGHRSHPDRLWLSQVTVG